MTDRAPLPAKVLGEIHYETQVQDLKDLYAYSQRVAARRSFAFLLVASVLPFSFLAWTTWLDFGWPDMWGTLLWFPVELALTLSCWGVGWFFLLTSPGRRAKAYMTVVPTSETAFRWSDAGVEEVSRNKREHFSWLEIRDIVETGEVILLVRRRTKQGIYGMVVPRRAFVNHASCAAFLDEARRRCQDSQS